MDEDLDTINVVPLVDVMLVLLTLVLTTASFVSTGRIPVDLAKAGHSAPAASATLVLTLTRDKALYLNDRPVTDLAQSLAGAAPGQSVVIRADAQLPLADLVALVDRVKALGHEQVALEVRRT